MQINQQNLNEHISEWRISYLTLCVIIQPGETKKYAIVDLDTNFNKVEKEFIYRPLSLEEQEWFLTECRYDTIAEALDDINYILDNPDKF